MLLVVTFVPLMAGWGRLAGKLMTVDESPAQPADDPKKATLRALLGRCARGVDPRPTHATSPTALSRAV